MIVITWLFFVKCILLLLLLLTIFVQIISLNEQNSNCDDKKEKEANLCLKPMLAFANAVQEKYIKNNFLI